MQAGLHRSRGNQRSNRQYSLDHRQTREFQETIYFYFTDYAKLFGCVDHNKLENSPDHLTCFLSNLYVGEEATELDMKQWIGSKLGKEYIKAVYCQPVYLLYRQSCCYSITKLCLTLCNRMNCSMRDLPVPHYLTELTQVHVR